MMHLTLSSSLENSISQETRKNVYCEAAGCFSIASNEIVVKIGKLGTITLSVCNNCIHKFSESEEENLQ
jgi:hypothetical protein